MGLNAHPHPHTQAFLSLSSPVTTTVLSSAQMALEAQPPHQHVMSSHPNVTAVSISFSNSKDHHQNRNMQIIQVRSCKIQFTATVQRCMNEVTDKSGPCTSTCEGRSSSQNLTKKPFSALRFSIKVRKLK